MTKPLTIADERVPLDEQYKRLMDALDFDTFNRSQDNPNAFPITKSGFFAVKSQVGKDLGFGFYCTRCKMSVPGGLTADSRVHHCGKVSEFPKGLNGFIAKLGLGLQSWRVPVFKFVD